MFRNLFASCCALVLFASASCALAATAGEANTRGYKTADQGELLLTVPHDWADEIRPGKNGMPPTITFHPAGSRAFQVMVTPITPPRPGLAMPGLDKVRASVEKARDEAAPQAAEKHITLHELNGPNARGYYFTATDKAPGSGPEDYRLMTQGEVVTDGAVVVMTILSNDDSGAVRKQALAMLKSAQHHPADQSLHITKLRHGYQITVPVSQLVLTLPNSKLEAQQGANEGAAASPRYFYFRDRSQGLIISGWFEPAHSFDGIENFWKNETATWKKNKLPEPKHVKFEKIGKWQAIAYDIDLPVPNANDTHLRAEYVGSGTWIDLHLSMTTRLSSAKARARLHAILKSFKVQVKKK